MHNLHWTADDTAREGSSHEKGIPANTLPVNIDLPHPRSRTDTFIWNWSNKCPSYLVSRSNSGCNQKGWETLRCGLEQYFDQAQPANLPMGTWGRDSTRYLHCLTFRTNPFELKLIWGTTPFWHSLCPKMHFRNVCAEKMQYQLEWINSILNIVLTYKYKLLRIILWSSTPAVSSLACELTVN